MKQLQNANESNGLVASSYDARDYSITYATKVEFPEKFELSMPPVKNQLTTPSCAAHAGSLIVEYFVKNQLNSNTEYSTEFIYGYRPEGYYVGDGMCLRDVCKTLLKAGDCPLEFCIGNNDYEQAMQHVTDSIDELKEKAYPHRVTSYFKLTEDYNMKLALMKYGPLLVSMNIHKKYSLLNGVYHIDDDELNGRHAVVVHGWNQNGWIIQNSWGRLWGDNGHFVLPYSIKLNEVWGFTDNIIENEDIKTPFATKLGAAIAKAFNAVVNLVRQFLK